MTIVRFWVSDLGTPRFEVDDQRFRALGAWAVIDISSLMGVCLGALAMVDDVARGRAVEPWSSAHYDLTLNRHRVMFSNRWADDERGEYTFAEYRQVVEDYLKFLVSRPVSGYVRDYWPELPEAEAEVRLWEETWHRAHPYRGRLC
ncbi:hypothetical protein [Asanoa siamensis]|uniref:Uncharacterized protein n=1 Tax=Asanoa siamensis TaxID=926357 RepID=A0ABQ4CPQ0_9ACTN|nr:hypothetical protein [Asanoa siamensis]GIF73261.1 hypothetical protein Asi02nite_27790 [Asanoa siamensis]